MQIIANVWQLRRQNGLVNKIQVQVDDQEKMANDIKCKAIELGAELVGITEISADAVYHGHKVSYKYCLLYKSDAADESLRVDLGGRRII